MRRLLKLIQIPTKKKIRNSQRNISIEKAVPKLGQPFSIIRDFLEKKAQGLLDYP